MEDSSLGRIVGVLISPTKTFEAIAKKPTWAVVLVVTVALSVGLSYLMSQRIDYEDMARDAIAQSGRNLTEEQLQGAIDLQEKIGPALSILAPLVVGPIVYLIIALLFWVLFKLFGGELSYRQSFSTALYGLVPWGVASVLNVPVVLGRSEIFYDDLKGGGNLLASNLGALAPEDAGAAVSTLLSAVDLFTIWSLFLLIVGYSIAAKTSRKTAAVVVIGLWVVYILGKMGWTALSS